MGRDNLPQGLDQQGVGVPFLLGDVFDVHIDAVQPVLLHISGNLFRQGCRVPQGQPPGGPVPVIAQHGHHPDTHIVHGVNELLTYRTNLQSPVFIDVKIAGRDGVQGAGQPYLFDLPVHRAAVQIGHAELCPGRNGVGRGGNLLRHRGPRLAFGIDRGEQGKGNGGNQDTRNEHLDQLDAYLSVFLLEKGEKIPVYMRAVAVREKFQGKLHILPVQHDNQIVVLVFPPADIISEHIPTACYFCLLYEYARRPTDYNAVGAGTGKCKKARFIVFKILHISTETMYAKKRV